MDINTGKYTVAKAGTYKVWTQKITKIIYTLNLTLKVSYGVELTSSPGQEQSLILKQDGNELDWSKVISIQARTIPYSILGGSST